MELTLTGRNFTGAEAASWGLVSRVVGEGEGQVVKEAVEMARVIASKSAIAVQAGKEAVNVAYESTLAEGLRYERRLFHGLFATKDQKEGGWLIRLVCFCPEMGCNADVRCRNGRVRREEEAELVTRVKYERAYWHRRTTQKQVVTLWIIYLVQLASVYHLKHGMLSIEFYIVTYRSPGAGRISSRVHSLICTMPSSDVSLTLFSRPNPWYCKAGSSPLFRAD